MHRSGTSAVAGALARLGVDLGDDLMAARAGENARGYFESVAVFEVHERALAAACSAWHDLRRVPAAWFESPTALELRGEIAALVESRFAASPAWGVKDPRLCRLLPLWESALAGCDVHYLLVARHPAEVAASLARRNGFSGEKAAWLWLDHTLAAVRASRGSRRAVVPFDRLLEAPVATLEIVAAELGTSWLRLPEGRIEALGELLSPELRHHRAAGGGALGRWSALAHEAYELLCSESGLEGSSEADWDRIEVRYEAAVAERDPLVFEHAAQMAADLRGELGALRGTLAERSRWIGQHDDRLAAQDRVIADESELTGERIAALQRHIARQEEQNARLERLVANAHDALERTTTEVRDELQRQSDEFRREVTVLRAVAERGRSLAEMLWSSKPWRLYLALGRLGRRLRGRSAGVRPAAARLTPLPAPAAGDPAASSGTVLSETVPDSIELPQHEEPTISIVIPVYNQIDFTLRCLDSIAQARVETPFEVLVVDDCSTDDTRERLADVGNLRLVSNATNGGFICSCNHGADEARGEYVLFLNNDTAVTDGWLDELVAAFENFADVGLVGGKLIFPDGTLQEAGGIVWRDGSAWNFGRGDSPDAPEYSYVREADYCSGACLMVPRELFQELGQFDSAYAPAYYEDVDLAFRVRAAGKRTLFQPLCRIYHYEGMSCGTDLTSGVKQYQVENGKRFFARWEETLASHRANGVEPEREKERGVERRVLIVDHRVPAPDQDAGSLRMWSLIEILIDEGFKVTLAPDNLDPAEPYTRRLQGMGVEVLYTPFVRSLRDHLEAHGALYDVVLLSRVRVADRHIDAVSKHCPRALTLFDTVDLHFVREMRQAELERDGALMRTAERTRQIELAVARKANKTLVVSEVDRAVVREHAPDLEVSVVSTIHDVVGTDRGFEERQGLLFVGGFEHTPNVDAAVWFVCEILPLVRAELPEIRLYLVGSKPTEAVLALASDTVEVTGYVPSVEPYLERCRLSVAPLRFGSGVKGKMNQSMALGVPCVATPLACEGMGLAHGVDVLVAESPADFAREVVRLYRDKALWEALSRGGIENIEEHFSFEVARRKLLQVIDIANPVAPSV